jgi:hypothetical protein
MTLTEIITKVLENPQLDVVLTEEGYDWMPNDFTGTTPFLVIADDEGLQNMAGDANPAEVVDYLAEYIRDNIREWIYDAIEWERRPYHDKDEERLSFLYALLEKV